MMACKSLLIVLLIVSLFGLHNCEFGVHPKGYERCVTKFMGEPWQLEFLCCVEAPTICFAGYLEEACLVRCPPLRKGKGRAKPSPPPLLKGKRGAKPSPSPSPSPSSSPSPSPSPLRKGKGGAKPCPPPLL
ncbi:unnamed protein product [Microthlaspi erraticum]|uniref:Uncharacterized protein n=1 Tax=Microthlaspi erraticum TaxID=1685480 RepID=A0A6D2JRT4_9BRAS|nr:unnamed protein product [Microthlaspi erraticum]